MSAAKAAVTSNTEPTGAVDSPIKVKTSKSNREYGLRPRGVRLTRTVTGGSGNEAVSKVLYSFLPILTAPVFESATFAERATVTINSVVWTILAKVQEDY
jgi:hypothetical protein